MKPLTLEETRLKEEMKNNCLKVGKYKDEKAKDKFEMLCHLEDFMIQYWELLKENKELKEVIDTILNWYIFKSECPINFGYDEETNEDKAQDVFYKDDDYCENNCNDDCTKCWLKYFKRMHELEKGDSNE